MTTDTACLHADDSCTHKSATGVNARRRMQGLAPLGQAAPVAAHEHVTGATEPVAMAYRALAQVAVRESAEAVPAAFRKPADVNGAQVLGYIRLLLARFVHWPSEAALDAVVLWIAMAAARDNEGVPIWRALARLLLTSEKNGSGKSTVLDLIALVLHSRFGRMPSCTPRALAQILGRYHEVAILDEAQTTFGTAKRSEDLRKAINAGYTRHANALAMSGGKADAVPVFGPVAMAGLDSLITDGADRLRDTLARSVIIRLDRAPVRMPEVDEDAEDAARLIGNALTAWTSQAGPELIAEARRLARAASEDDDLDAADIRDGGRYAQICRPMRACANIAGGRWPEAAQRVVEELAQTAVGGDKGESAMEDLGAIMAAWGSEGTEWA